MSRVRFELDLKGLNDLMKSPEMQSVMQAKGQEIAGRAGSMSTDQDADYESVTYPINWIAVTNIRCANGAAVRENSKHNTLLKALGGG